jgi:hypothetical protein
LARESLGEHAVLRPEIPIEQAREHALIVDEGGEALAHLPVVRVEEPREHRPNRRLLLFDVGTQLAIDVREQARADFFEPRLLPGGVRVVESPQPDAPCVKNEPLTLSLVEVAEQSDALGAAVAHVGRDLLGGKHHGHLELLRARHVRHGHPPYRSDRARPERALRLRRCNHFRAP